MDNQRRACERTAEQIARSMSPPPPRRSQRQASSANQSPTPESSTEVRRSKRASKPITLDTFAHMTSPSSARKNRSPAKKKAQTTEAQETQEPQNENPVETMGD